MNSANKLSKIIGLKFVSESKGDIRSKSQKLFSELGLIRSKNGFCCLSPILTTSLRKLENLVRKKMNELSALEILLPSLSESKLLVKSGRDSLPDIFKLSGNLKENYFLNPTCEEAIADLLSADTFLTLNKLPLRLYQISSKFRNEKRPKHGLLRCNEFQMKDLYCFDSSLKKSEDTYKEVKKKYHEFFQELGVPYMCVKGLEGDIGGLQSDEFHFISDAGDDILSLCQDCGFRQSLESENILEKVCSKCNSKNIKTFNGIEVAHTFNLGTRYTEAFRNFYKDELSKKVLLSMSCFGLGLTRILAASVELLSEPQQIKWPLSIAPYLISFLPPKAGSKEDIQANSLAKTICNNLYHKFQHNLIVDDRTSWTIGKRLSSIKELGLPFAVVAGKNILKNPPEVEFHDLYESQMYFVHPDDILGFAENKMQNTLLGKPNDDLHLESKIT